MGISHKRRMQEDCPDALFHVFSSRPGKVGLSAGVTRKENYSAGEICFPFFCSHYV